MYKRDELIKIFASIPEPNEYIKEDWEMINEKTKYIKKIQKKFDLDWVHVYRIYKLELNKIINIANELCKKEKKNANI